MADQASLETLAPGDLVEFDCSQENARRYYNTPSLAPKRFVSLVDGYAWIVSQADNSIITVPVALIRKSEAQDSGSLRDAYVRAIEELKAKRSQEFLLSEFQQEKVRQWTAAHECKYSGNVGAIGGRYTHEFTPTSIGMIARLRCACGSRIDLTDYGSW